MPLPDTSPSSDWRPDSWQSREVSQQPRYESPEELQTVLRELGALPPLVTSWEILSLREKIAQAGRGEAFLLQGGDCSESLQECSSTAIIRNFKVMLQMSLVLAYGAKREIVRIGRVAGQYAKPRSDDQETRDGQTLPVYRGDLVNRVGFTAQQRRPDPNLLLRCYERSALTLNYIRALSVGGFADLHYPENWELEFAHDSPRSKQYHELVASISHTLSFVENVAGGSPLGSRGVEFFTSHEGLLLNYEQAQTRHVDDRPGWYDLSTHFPWIGNRTRQLNGAHVEFFRGIANPVGVKIDGDIEPAELVALTKTLNPDNLAGKLVLIHRLGAKNIEQSLPPLLDAVARHERQVTWVADPMHGNTFRTQNGAKTRDFEAILSELRHAIRLHGAQGSRLGGVHLELTGDDVTECIGGASNLTESDLSRAYKSTVDPRLNYDQAMEIAFLIVEEMKG